MPMERVLIIEGELNLRGELTSALDKANFAVVDVSNFPEALLKTGQFKPDIVIMDVVLPGGDGMEACYQLHRILGIPIILLGKDASGEACWRALEAGADSYFTKPASHQEVVARVKAILRRYKRE